VDQFELHSL